MSTFNYGHDSARATRYQAKAARERELIQSTDDTLTYTPTQVVNVTAPTPTVVTPSPTPELVSPAVPTQSYHPTPTPNPAHHIAVATPVDDNVIHIENKKIKVEVIYNPNLKSAFIVGVIAYSVEVSDDGVSILLDGTLSIKPPTLEALSLRIDGVEYKVVYAGGSHTFGKFQNISFVRTNGKASSD